MGKALYRKYRSRSLSEIVGQEHITQTLENALKQGRIAHAYLLTGPRGVGKTSVARILAYEVNSLPYSEDPHLDIIEIDAASNNGVEDVRELRDKIPSAPVSAKYKVFIIDEVHMLSKAAFNALLKTLEEPPAHVIFILATTEAHKLPETIISRTQRFSFRPVPPAQVIAHLRTIADKESLTVDDDALAEIAAHGEGSFRDSISLLDQASSVTSHITKAAIEQLLGRAPAALIEDLLERIATHDGTGCIRLLTQLVDQGYEPAMIAAQLGQSLREQLVDTSTQPIVPVVSTLALLRDLIDIPASPNPRVLLEITLLRHSLEPQTASSSPAAVPAQQSKSAATTNVPAPATNKPAQPRQQPTSEPTAAKPAKPAEPTAAAASADATQRSGEAPPSDEAPATTPPTSPDQSVDELWHAVLQEVKKSHNTLYGIARMAKPSLTGDTLTLALTFTFHQKRLNEPHNKAVVATIVEQVRQTPTQIVCVIATKETTTPALTDVATISNIFGGAELLES